MGIFVAVMQVLNSDRSCDLFEYAHELNSAAPAFGSTLRVKIRGARRRWLHSAGEDWRPEQFIMLIVCKFFFHE